MFLEGDNIQLIVESCLSAIRVLFGRLKVQLVMIETHLFSLILSLVRVRVATDSLYIICIKQPCMI